MIKDWLYFNIWYKIAPFIYRINVLYAIIRYKLFGKKIDDMFDIPIYINNYNRLSYLVQLIDGLEARGYKNIHIIDNNSSYKPLLNYYSNCKYDVIRLNENIGFLSIWKTGIYKKIWNSYYVYTDSDILLGDSCPSDFLNYFLVLLEKYRTCHKVGFALRIDDIPDCFSKKKEVIAHEKQFWEKEIETNVYSARIDTTFALYRPYCKGPSNSFKFVLRVAGVYSCRHQPWYVDTRNPSDEEKFYISSIRESTHWSAEIKRNLL